MFLAFLDANFKLSGQMLAGWGVGICVSTATLVGVGTRAFLKKNGNGNSHKYLQTKEMCNEKHRTLEGKIDTLQSTMNTRFDDLKDLIRRSNGGV